MTPPRRLVVAVPFSIAILGGAVVAFSGTSCKSAGYEDAPDSSISCKPGAHIFCTPDAPTGCDVLPNDPNPHLAKLAPGRYAVACVANFVAEARDVGGDCVVEAVCRCSEPTAGVGNADAGDEAGPPPAPSSHWTCFP